MKGNKHFFPKMLNYSSLKNVSDYIINHSLIMVFFLVCLIITTIITKLFNCQTSHI